MMGPEEYKGVKVPGLVRRWWLNKPGRWWCSGVDDALNAVRAKVGEHSRNIGPDDFSHQEDAYHAGVSDAADLVTEMSEAQ